MKFSIIIATFGRKKEVSDLLHSLHAQIHQDFELIIVDQNPPEFLQDIRAAWAGKYLAWENVDFKSANRARNMGLGLASGDIVTFADDDCEYLPETLKSVQAIFKSKPALSVITGRAMDKASGEDCMATWPKSDMPVSVANVLTLSLEFTTFYRRAVLGAEMFDTAFGPGTEFGSREGPDLLLRLMYAKQEIHYFPEVCLYHPHKFTCVTDPNFLKRTKVYEQGFGALFAKHLLLRRSWPAILMLFHHLFIRAGLAVMKNGILLRGDKLKFWKLLICARLYGFNKYRAQWRELQQG